MAAEVQSPTYVTEDTHKASLKASTASTSSQSFRSQRCCTRYATHKGTELSPRLLMSCPAGSTDCVETALLYASMLINFLPRRLSTPEKRLNCAG